MRITIFGANGPTGRVTTRNALAAGHHVVAVTRHVEDFPVAGERLTVAAADVHDPVATASAIAGADAVISTLGVPFGRRPVSVYSRGLINIANGMRAHGVRRLVAVTSSVIDLQPDPRNSWFFENAVQPFVIKVLGRTVYDDMRRGEAAVRASGLDWTIVRPFGLFDTETTSDYQMSERPIHGRFTSRADLADALLRMATGDEHIGEAVELVTTENTPRFIDFLLKEAR
ncbi:MAG: NAD(P)H-binding protein [Pseudolysinimonas sp.]